jgi:hypothetical protein
VIVLEVLWLTFAVIFLVPKFQRLMRDGMIDRAILEEHGVAWMASFLRGLTEVGGHYTTWLLLLAIVVCGLFEWRVRSENKSFIRLSAWGTLAVGLLVVGVLTAGTLVVPYLLAAPESVRIARPFALQQIASIDTAAAALEQALAKQDWASVQRHASQAAEALDVLAAAGPAVGSLTPRYGPPNSEELRAQLRSAGGCLAEAREAAREKDAGRVGAAVRKFRALYEPVEKAATNPRG